MALSPPFAPNADVVDLQSPSAAAQQGGLANGIAAHLQQNGSFSVVSSLPSFSALYDCNPDDFPAFADSREFASESFHQQQQQQDWWEGERTPANGLQSIAQQDESEASMIGHRQQPLARFLRGCQGPALPPLWCLLLPRSLPPSEIPAAHTPRQARPNVSLGTALVRLRYDLHRFQLSSATRRILNRS